MNDQECDLFDQLMQEYELRMRVYHRRRQNLRYCMLGSAIGTALFWVLFMSAFLFTSYNQ